MVGGVYHDGEAYFGHTAADPRAESTKGITAHHFAVDSGHQDVVNVIDNYLQAAGHVQ
jgi:hypothetical protein